MQLTHHRYKQGYKQGYSQGYDQERQRVETATRMIHYQARTNTICRLTGLTDDRIRKLHKSCVGETKLATQIRRKRGKSPQQIECLLRNADVQLHASVLAGTFVAVGLSVTFWGNSNNAQRSIVNETTAERLCDAYELYLHLLDKELLTFEHAWFLWKTLNRTDDLQLRACPTCSALILVDSYSVRGRPCPWCASKNHAS